MTEVISCTMLGCTVSRQARNLRPSKRLTNAGQMAACSSDSKTTMVDGYLADIGCSQAHVSQLLRTVAKAQSSSYAEAYRSLALCACTLLSAAGLADRFTYSAACQAMLQPPLSHQCSRAHQGLCRCQLVDINTTLTRTCSNMRFMSMMDASSKSSSSSAPRMMQQAFTCPALPLLIARACMSTSWQCMA